MKIVDILTSGFEQGIIWAILVIGVYISFRILDIADLSIEGTFPLGACVVALMMFLGVNPFIACIIAMISGMIGGLVTGLLHTKLKIPAILSGIITMTALVSINLVILGFASKDSQVLSILSMDRDVFTIFTDLLMNLFKMQRLLANTISVMVVSVIFLAIVAGLVYWLFGTEIGMSVRATGCNERMARAQGIDTDLMKILGLSLSNGLIALSGALFAQDTGTAMVESGRGAIVIGLAAIIIGEIIFGRKTFKRSLISIIVGSIIFFIIKALAIRLNVEHFLDLLTAILIAVILAMPLIKKKLNFKKEVKANA